MIDLQLEVTSNHPLASSNFIYNDPVALIQAVIDSKYDATLRLTANNIDHEARINYRFETHTVEIGHDIEKEIIITFAKVLLSANRPINFSLCHRKINNEDAITLANAIANYNTPFTIDLDHNEISNKGAIALAQAILHTKHPILFIRLSYNKIGDEGAIALAHTIANYNAPVHISLDGNEISDKGAIALAQAILHTKHPILSMRLGYNKIGNEGAIALTHAIANTNQEILLTLYNNDIKGSGIRALEQAIKVTFMPCTIEDDSRGDGNTITIPSFLGENEKSTNPIFFTDQAISYIESTIYTPCGEEFEKLNFLQQSLVYTGHNLNVI